MELDPHLREVWLKAEISNFKLHSRGHMYLTLKDDKTRIQAVMFSRMNRNLAFMPEDGMNVLVKGQVGIFEAFGQYQLYISEMQPDGIGSLYMAYEQLKEKLSKLGYFNPDNKKKIPRFPKKIGVITSPTGAVIRDIITTIKRRYPLVEITVFPVIVQGVNGCESITKAIKQANETATYDTLIVGRGGGSIEELWNFNEEEVVKAIYNSKIPIISAVGHETDTTLSDYVADLRAPTPTAAAELAVPSKDELIARIENIKSRLTFGTEQFVQRKYEQVARLKTAYAFRYPEQLVIQKEQELDRLTDRLFQNSEYTIQRKEAEFKQLTSQMSISRIENQYRLGMLKHNEIHNNLQSKTSTILDHKSKRLDTAITKLALLNPLETMKRGFAIPYDTNKNIIYSVKETEKEDAITVTLADGELYCTVDDKKENNVD